jgi:hypothetical protein
VLPENDSSTNVSQKEITLGKCGFDGIPGFPGWVCLGIVWKGDFAGVHFVINLAVMGFTFEMFTDFEIVIGSYCYISFVE